MGSGSTTLQHGQKGRDQKDADPGLTAAFDEELKAAQSGIAQHKGARAQAEDEPLETVAIVPAQGIQTPTPTATAANPTPTPAAHRLETDAVAQKIVQEVHTAERLSLSLGWGTKISVPITAPNLGLSGVTLVLSGGQIAVIVTPDRSADPKVVAAALHELTATLAQKFPHRSLRVDLKSEGQDVVEDGRAFAPLNQPITRRGT